MLIFYMCISIVIPLSFRNCFKANAHALVPYYVIINISNVKM